MKCPKCNAENPAGMRFCGQCAAPLPQLVKCPNCGAENPAGMRFCGQCATALTAPAQKPKPAPTPPPAPDAEQTLVGVRPPKAAPPPPAPKAEPKPATPAADETIIGKKMPPPVPKAAPPPPPAPKAEPKPAAAKADETVVGKPCPQCGYLNQPGMRFCEQCATPLDQKKAAPPPAPKAEPKPVAAKADETVVGKPCPRCGHNNQPGMRFCEQCATPLTQPTAPPAWYTRRRTLIGGGVALGLLLVAVVTLLLVTTPFRVPVQLVDEPTGADGVTGTGAADALPADPDELYQPVTQEEAIRRAAIVEEQIPGGLEGEPVMRVEEGENGTTYDFEYTREQVLETEDGPVTVEESTIIVVDGETGRTRIVHTQ